ncbi:hypothetical protein F8388_020088 [Cannabis sativa]|uniref:Reverse transcriptase zinc-binding domain-containing protein n=1 Tax=Cannabis sativa TaxID=3483 RepID=A0A7J6F7T4_CANSA|nr:hypothetical protein F8388_020088 [Cannabis sativa]
MGEPNGKFSIRSACRILKRDTEVNGDSEVWKLIWNSPLHTRLKFVWWQLIRDIFPTKDKLAPFLDGITGTCLLCREEAENSLHLFWKCTFTKAIWFSIGWGIRTEMVTATDWKQWMEGFWKGLNLPPNIDFYDFMVTCLCIVESVWKERNRRVHGEMEKDIMQISRSIRQKINDHIMVSEKIVHEITEWRPPPSDWVCCNSDVAVSPVGSFLSAVIRDDVGNIISISSQESRVTLPKLAEAKAVCLAAEKAKDLGLKKIMFQSDNIGVVKAFEASMDICMDFMLQDSKVRFNNICSKFSDWGIVHVSRKCNYMAHNIAKWAAVKNVLGICQEEVDASVLDDLREWEPDLGRDTLGSGDLWDNKFSNEDFHTTRVSKDVVNDEKKERVDDDFFKGYSQLPVEDDDVVTAGLKVVAKFQQLYALVPYDPQSTTSSNLTPYAQQLSSSSKVAVVTSKVKGLCALQQLIVDDVNDDDEKAFDAWF